MVSLTERRDAEVRFLWREVFKFSWGMPSGT
jgi:hypothetical protein